VFKPVIAAVNGYAFAAGLETALLADIRIAADNAEFGALERRWNIVAGDGLTARLPLVVGELARGRLRAYIPGGFEFVAARDIVEGHRLVMDKGRTGQRYIFSSGYTTLDELMTYFEEVTGRRRPRIAHHVPDGDDDRRDARHLDQPHRTGLSELSGK